MGSDNRRWLMLAFMLLGQFTVLSGVGSLNIALPSIRADLEASPSVIQWVLIVYQLGFALTLVTGGRLGDMFGRKRVFSLGLAGFVVTSALAAAAPSAGVLIAARAAQGICGGMTSPQILAMIQVTFSDAERRTAFAAFSSVATGAFMVGAVMTGFLLSADVAGLGWRAAFVMNVVVGLAALAGVRAVVPATAPGAHTPLDLVGVGLLTSGALLVLYPLIQGRSAGWPPGFFVSMALAAPVLVAFVAHERRVAARGGAPLVKLELFRLRTFRLGLGTGVTFSFFALPSYVMLTYTVQSGLGYDALQTALLTAPTSLGLILASIVAARLAPRLGRRIFAVAGVVNAVAAGATIAAFGWGGGSVAAILTATLLLGCGHGLCSSPMTHLALSDVSAGQAGSASGVLQTVQQSTGAVGVSVLGIVFFGVLDERAGLGAYGSAITWVFAIVVACAGVLVLLHLAMPATVGGGPGRGARAPVAPPAQPAPVSAPR